MRPVTRQAAKANSGRQIAEAPGSKDAGSLELKSLFREGLSGQRLLPPCPPLRDGASSRSPGLVLLK